VIGIERCAIDAGSVALRGTAARPATGGPWSRVDGSVTFATDDPLEEPARADVGLRAEESGWRATIVSRDAGRLLRHYGVDAVRGGRATFEGMVDLAAGGAPFDGRLTVEQVTVVRAPWLVKLVSLASARGLLDLGAPQAVLFDRVVAGVGHRPPVVALTDGVARGPKLALALAGTIDHGADALDLEGTLVPSYFLLNEGAARIPILGPVLGGSAVGAVQAVGFAVRGPRAEPTVTVRPLSSLAPGMLREWLRRLGR
jgi:hypothetical protein